MTSATMLTIATLAVATATTANPASIAEIAFADERFSTLVAAVSAAGLVDT